MLRRLFATRLMRFVLWTSLTLITLIVLLYVWTNWSGRRRWAAAQAMIEAQGETLDFRKLLPTTPPDAQNLLAIDPLRDIAAVVDGEETRGGPGARRKALEVLKWNPTPSKAPPAQGIALGQAAGFQEWEKYLREAKIIDLPANTQPGAGNFLAALDAKFPLLKQLADEAPKRPQAMFTPGLREREMPGMLMAMRVPHYSVAQNLGRMLGLRARMAVAAGDSAEAAHTILAAIRLAQGCKREPMLIAYLVAQSVELMALEPLWLGLRAHVFTGDDLRLLQNLLSVDDTQAALLQSMRGELAAGLDVVEQLRASASGKRGGSADAAKAASADADVKDAVRAILSGSDAVPAPVRESEARRALLLAMLPGGLFDHWKSALAEVEVRSLLAPLKEGRLMQAIHAASLAEQDLKQNSNLLRHPDRLMVKFVVPAVTPVVTNALLGAARWRQAQTAVALEQFFARQSRYPATLEELVPEFLPAVPLDPCDEKPLRYANPAPDRFSLWSVGVDGKDNGGKVTTEPDGRVKLGKSDYLGDWTWTYAPGG
ncbi:MAG: hypothetical protein ACO1TE_19975 [Prosthecobacter sp.]